MRYSQLDHVGYAVSDLERSIDWYAVVLDEQPPAGGPDISQGA